MHRDEVVAPGERKDRGGGEPGKDLGQPVELAGRKVKHQVAMIASLEGRFDPYPQIVGRGIRDELSLAAFDGGEYVHPILSQACPGVAEVDDRVCQSGRADTFERSAHGDDLDVD